MSPPTEIDFHNGIANVMMNKVGNRWKVPQRREDGR